MLTVTETAAQMIARLAQQAQLPERGGLRIAQRPDVPCLQMALAAEPGLDDNVVVVGPARVFLDPSATQRLAHEVLDARQDGAGPSFYLDSVSHI